MTGKGGNEIIFGDFPGLNIYKIPVIRPINLLDAKGYQWETQNKVRILVLDMFNIAIENDFALKNPSKGIRLTKNKPNDRVVLFVEQQEDFFEGSAGTFYHNLFLVANHIILVSKTLLYQKLNGDDGKELEKLDTVFIL